jgi:hypothetical protein
VVQGSRRFSNLRASSGCKLLSLSAHRQASLGDSLVQTPALVDCMSVPSASKRPLPPARLNWDLPPLPLETLDLPPLPAVNDAELARQARTTAQHIPAAAGRTGNLRREDELSSYGRLEYVGDAVLHDLYARTLYRQFPRADSGLLSVSRSTAKFLLGRQPGVTPV